MKSLEKDTRWEDVMLDIQKIKKTKKEFRKKSSTRNRKKVHFRDMGFNNQSIPVALNNKNRWKSKQKSGE